MINFKKIKKRNKTNTFKKGYNQIKQKIKFIPDQMHQNKNQNDDIDINSFKAFFDEKEFKNITTWSLINIKNVIKDIMILSYLFQSVKTINL